MKEWLKQHWKVVAAVGAGAIGLYLLWQRSQGAAAAPAAAPAAATDSGLPSTGAAPVDTGAPPQYLNAGEQAAAGLAQYQAQQAAYPQPLSIQQQISNAEQQEAAFLSTNPISGATATGVVQQRWKQVVDAGQVLWEDVSGKNRAPITEQLAQLESQVPKGEGPYYQSAGGTGISGAINKFVVKPVESVLGAAIRTATSGAVAGAVSGGSTPANPPNVAPPSPSVSPVTGTPEQQATIATVHHVPGPTTPAGIPNHAVGAH